MFVSLGSHDFKHAMHVIYESHYSQKTHDHTAHNHSDPETQPQNHPIDASLMSYVKDYLYAGLQFNSREKNQSVKQYQNQTVDSYVAIHYESYIEDMLPVKGVGQ